MLPWLVANKNLFAAGALSLGLGALFSQVLFSLFNEIFFTEIYITETNATIVRTLSKRSGAIIDVFSYKLLVCNSIAIQATVRYLAHNSVLV